MGEHSSKFTELSLKRKEVIDYLYLQPHRQGHYWKSLYMTLVGRYLSERA